MAILTIVRGNERTKLAVASDTVQDLLKELDLSQTAFAVALNGRIISHARRANALLSDDDLVEVIPAIAGG